MKITKLRDAMHAAPFQPFTIHTGDGRSVHVPHPDFIALMGDGRTAVVTSPEKEASPSYLLIDVPLITQLEIQGTATNGA
ncbi:MAG TPA: hypothetical protein VJU77_10255 [Chthoniobacterales bacterium]|nr:hypothetical protein [Chthoniobacterales bacterium]